MTPGRWLPASRRPRRAASGGARPVSSTANYEALERYCNALERWLDAILGSLMRRLEQARFNNISYCIY